MGSTSARSAWLVGRVVFGCRNRDLFHWWGSGFSHRIPTAQSSGKRALYIYTRHREKTQCCPTLDALSQHFSQLDLQPSAVKQSQNKSAEISFWGGAGHRQISWSVLSQKAFPWEQAKTNKQSVGDKWLQRARKVHQWLLTECLCEILKTHSGLGFNYLCAASAKPFFLQVLHYRNSLTPSA